MCCEMCPKVRSILVPLLLLIYVNDLLDVFTKYTVHMYADDVAIYFVSKDVKEVADSVKACLTLLHGLTPTG